MKQITAYAPASVGNAAVGFDILGFAVDGVGDTVIVSEHDRPGVVIEEITGIAETLPTDPAANTATVGLLKMIQDLQLRNGFRVKIRKAIPLGSGMGGSASSAVAAVVAADALLGGEFTKEELLEYALAGEAVASGAAHADNIAPCLFGGLVVAVPGEPIRVKRIPVPVGIFSVLVHPRIRLDTRESRAVLKPELSLHDHVRQSANLAGFIAGCFTGDFELIRATLSDILIEPQRARLIPGFAAVKAAALGAGAMGCSISGSGPSVFAWAESSAAAGKIAEVMVQGFAAHGLRADSWISQVSANGARVVPS